MNRLHPISSTEKLAEISEFYLACRNGDLDFVRIHLATPTEIKNDFNPLEPVVNSTPLHVASFYGHKDIVQLLLKYGCDRSKINAYGLTAYEEAANAEIRELFKRPSISADSQRFQDECIDDCYDFVAKPKENKKVKIASITTSSSQTEKKPEIQTYRTKAEKELEIGYATTSIVMCQSKLGRFITDKLQKNPPMSLKTIGTRIQDIIDQELVANEDSESSKAKELLEKFLTDNPKEHIKYLIRLYTLETRFYHCLRKNPMPLALPLYMALPHLKDRYFQGQSYRGGRMTGDEIMTYESAAHNQGSFLQNKFFASTSKQRSIAENFADAATKMSTSNRKNRVLFIFNFPEACDQAIDLTRISDTQTCLSEFENEDEVLILPWALFQVEYVHKQSLTSYIIYLTSVLLPQKDLFSSLKWILKHPKGCLARFNENFPDRKPQFITKQLMTTVSKFDATTNDD